MVCNTDRYYGSSNRESLNLQLYYSDGGDVGPAVTVSVNWQRPSGNAGQCADEGSRSVSVTQSVPLAAGQSATIRGDAGLTVSLSRR